MYTMRFLAIGVIVGLGLSLTAAAQTGTRPATPPQSRGLTLSGCIARSDTGTRVGVCPRPVTTTLVPVTFAVATSPAMTRLVTDQFGCMAPPARHIASRPSRCSLGIPG